MFLPKFVCQNILIWEKFLFDNPGFSTYASCFYAPCFVVMVSAGTQLIQLKQNPGNHSNVRVLLPGVVLSEETRARYSTPWDICQSQQILAESLGPITKELFSWVPFCPIMVDVFGVPVRLTTFQKGVCLSILGLIRVDEILLGTQLVLLQSWHLHLYNLWFVNFTTTAKLKNYR